MTVSAEFLKEQLMLDNSDQLAQICNALKLGAIETKVGYRVAIPKKVSLLTSYSRKAS